MRNNKHTPHIITLSFLVIIAAFLIFFRLGQNPLRPYDEGIYAQVAKEMVNEGNWLTQYYNNQPWFEKPPLQTWITASFFRLFEINEFWARAASAISAFLLVMLTYFLGRKILGKRVGFLAVIILLSNYEFLRGARFGQMDMMLSLFIYLSVFAYSYTKIKSKFWYFFWIAFSFAFMTKFWAAGVILIILLILLILENEFHATIKNKNFWQGVLVSISIILPWHFIMLFMHYDQFIDRYFLFDLVQRTVTGMQGNIGPPLFYYDLLQHRFSPWYLLIPFALTINFYEQKKGNWRSETLILYIIIIVIFGLYSFIIQTKIFQYITPVFPAICLLIGSLIIKAFDSHKSFPFLGLVYASFIALMIATIKQIVILVSVSGIAFFCLVICHYILRKTNKKSINTDDTQIQRQKGLSTSPNTFLNIFSSLTVKELVYKFAVVVMLFLFVGVGLRRSFELYSYQPSNVVNIAKIASTVNTDDLLLGVCFAGTGDLCVLDPILLFYSNRPVIIAWSEKELATILESQENKEIIIAHQLKNQLSSEYNFKVIDAVPPFIYGTIDRK